MEGEIEKVGDTGWIIFSCMSTVLLYTYVHAWFVQPHNTLLRTEIVVFECYLRLFYQLIAPLQLRSVLIIYANG